MTTGPDCPDGEEREPQVREAITTQVVIGRGPNMKAVREFPGVKFRQFREGSRSNSSAPRPPFTPAVGICTRARNWRSCNAETVRAFRR